MRLIYCISLVLFLSACDSLDTSFNINKKDQPPPIPQKGTTCKVDFAKTCWPKTLQKVMSCIEGKQTGTFSFDKKFCTNSQQMLIEFKNPGLMFVNPYDYMQTPIDFRLLADSKNECFRVHGTRGSFEITLSQTGEKVVYQNDGTTLKFSCLDGQEVQIDTKNFEGCSDKLGSDFDKSVPGFDLQPTVYQGVEIGWTFGFRGTGLESAFQCSY